MVNMESVIHAVVTTSEKHIIYVQAIRI